ncbi:hypothetical protein A0H81_08671 [Grifola frondosa]|uniref:Fungal-type protein kinase domain-containing protein n=1 Tax=Grifola frondosa TaxID=5627 RepID=A0A1C7M423_GRIFR|nr:hypothetical protein A0H81_08671 [Grifola frondosa]
MIPRGNASSSAFNVPMALHDSGEQTGGLNPKHAKSRNSRNVQEAEKFILGPMPIQDFLDTFLQDSASDERKNHMRSSRNAFNAVPQRGDKASDITKPLLTALRSSTKYRFRCPGFSFQNTSVRVRHTQRLSSMKPDIICFASHHLDAVKSSSRRSRTDLGYTALFVDVKPDPEQDFFNDPPSDADADARDSHQFILNIDDEDTRQQASRALGQHISYVTEVSDVERGYDPTVGPASEGEEILFREAITSYVKLQLDVEEDELGQAVREHYKRGAVSAIHVTVKDGDVHRNRRFIVSRPVMSPLWPVGRGTRGYWAVDADSHQVVFLKDTWRYDGEDDDREGNILEGLNDLGVRYIPTVICHGDIPYYNLGEVGKGDSDNDHDASSIQSTLTHRYKPNAWVCGKVGYDLKRFKGTNELLHATYDVFQAMIDASEKARRIHRDISLGNIILVKEPDCTLRRGYLADWEVSCKTDSEGLACNAGRAASRAPSWKSFECIDIL